MEPTISHTPTPQKSPKKIIAVITGVIVVVVAVAVFTFTLLRSVEQKPNTEQSESNQKATKETADAEYKIGRDKQASGDLDAAKAAFEKAQKSYEQLGDKAAADEVTRMIKLLESQPRQTAPQKTAPAASQPE